MQKKLTTSPRRVMTAKRPQHTRQSAGTDAERTHAIRIVGGQWKRTKLKIPAMPNLRPTPDRVRETLFNWLGQDLTGWCCLDVFAGTGALGFEAASRGAQQVVLIENNHQLAALLQATQQRLDAQTVRVLQSDGLSALRRVMPATQDLIFLDPPFASDLHASALVAAARPLKTSGLVFLEAPIVYNDHMLAPWGFAVHRHLQAGAVHAHLLRVA